MNLTEWLSLQDEGSLSSEFTLCSERSLFLFSCEVLQRVRKELPSDAQIALDTTRAFALGLVSIEELLESWVAAEYSSELDLWNHRLFGDCPCCNPIEIEGSPEVIDLRLMPGARSMLRNPEWLAARAVMLAQKLCIWAIAPAQKQSLLDQEKQIQFQIFSCLCQGPPGHHRWRNYPFLEQEGIQLFQATDRGGQPDPICLHVLADAAEEAGNPPEVLQHLRSPGPHFRHCWAVEFLAGRSGLQLPSMGPSLARSELNW